jgi:hypothetical protein
MIDRGYGRVVSRAGGFVEPRVTDLGSLVELTRSSELFFGPAMSHAHDLSFSSAVTPNHHDVTIAASGAPLGAGGTPSAGAGAGATTAAGGAAAGGAQLPFTGYPLTTAAALGGTLAAAGVAIREKLERTRRD